MSSTMPATVTRAQWADACMCAFVMEDDWLTLRLLIDAPEQRWPGYYAECRARLMDLYGWCPYPFDEETP